MKILLVEPPINAFTGLIKRGYPIGLCMLAAVAHQENAAEVSVYDVDKCTTPSDGLDFTNQHENMARYLQGVNDPCHPVWKQFSEALRTFKPDVVGITTMTIQYASALQTARLVKEWNSDCVVIMGGPHASVMPRIMVDWPYTDIVVKGEGEETFLEIVKRLKANQRDVETIPGVLTKNNPGALDRPGPEIECLDSLPVPDRTALVNLGDYSPEDLGLMLTSRGCPYHCTYCSNFTRKTRFQSVGKILAEVEQVQRNFGTRQFMFKDDSFTLRRSRVADLCNAILQKRLNILWECTTRLDLLDAGLVRLMKQAGCNRVGVGVESGDEEMLGIYGKRLTKQQIREGVQLLRENGIFWTGYFMMALPMEKEDQIVRTLEFMRELSPSYAAIGVYKPYPGTKLFAMAEELGLVKADVDNSHFFETNPVDYFLADAHRRCAYISEERLAELIGHVQTEFEKSNKRLSNVFRRAFSRRRLYFADPKSMVVDLKRARKWLLR
ncbi:MAG: radical SAM protein [Sedimentisphaerales bacterium]|nr:radical SAM protein [Sedimentisphaerales bacterium]